MYELPETLQTRLAELPSGLQAHVERVRGIACELASVHSVDASMADLTAAAHDLARHLSGPRLIEEAERLGLPIDRIERVAPILLHGPVAARWLRDDGIVTVPEVLAGVHWHTTAHPDLEAVGHVVFIADKLDPAKAKAYPFQGEVRSAAFRSLHDGMLTFLDYAIRRHVDHREATHPMSTETRNRLLMGRSC
jgi:predicted HD superfamily hydrolase involved in NAD metabolism